MQTIIFTCTEKNVVADIQTHLKRSNKSDYDFLFYYKAYLFAHTNFIQMPLPMELFFY